MYLPKITPASASRRAAGFSLVEVTLAIGIVAFAFVALFGMVPTGLTIFRNSVNQTMQSQVAQKIIGDMQQTDFDTLKDKLVTEGDTTGAGITSGKAIVYYFNDQGNEMPRANNIDTINARPITPGNVLYTALVTGRLSSAAPPATVSSQGNTPPVAGPPAFASDNMLVVTVRIINDPAHSRTNMNTAFNGKSVPVGTFTAFVARNSTRITP